MSKPYFNNIPNFEYVSRIATAKNISDTILVKNLFKRGKIREDILNELTYFTKYKVIGDDRPDNVAKKMYGTPYLDWLILLSNNIMNIETEWPLTEDAFNKYLYKKYQTEEKIFSTHHYETQLLQNSLGRTIVSKGFEVPKNYTITYYDEGRKTENIATNIVDEISNYTYETRKQDNRRNVFILKDRYVGLIITDLGRIMPYKKGSSQYVNSNIVKGEKIRLYN